MCSTVTRSYRPANDAFDRYLTFSTLSVGLHGWTFLILRN